MFLPLPHQSTTRVVAVTQIENKPIKESAADVLPDRQLTPGVAAVLDATRVCEPGFSSLVRPKGNLWRRLKDEAYRRYGISHGDRSQVDSVGLRRAAYQIDHLIPLELGGDPTNILNLWPQLIEGAKRKNAIENTLHTQVCNGEIPLQDAQRRIAKDWTTAVSE